MLKNEMIKINDICLYVYIFLNYLEYKKYNNFKTR